jgi:TnpA family transposase
MRHAGRQGHACVFMLDYLVNPEFRREIRRLLAQGESLHALQRALLAGRIEAKHGRTEDDANTISGALPLLTNVVLAWPPERSA